MLKAFFSRRPAFDIDEGLREAGALLGRGKANEAEKLCRKALLAQPANGDAKQLLGAILLQQGNLAEAEAMLVEALRTAPEAVAALNLLGRAQLGLRRPVEALASFRKALQFQPTSPDGHVGQASALVALGRHDEALAAFKRVLALDPGQADAVAGLGGVLEAMGRVDEALAEYDKALALHPRHVAVLNQRGNALQNLGRYAEALADAENALAVDPDSIVATFGRGNALRSLGRDEEALAEYDRAMVLAPDFSGGPYNRALVLNSLRRHDEAIAAYQWAISLQPDFVQALFNCAVLMGDRNRHDEALAMFETLLAIDPDYPHVPGNIALERAHLCAWDGRDDVVRRVEDGVRHGKPVSVPLSFLAMSQDAAAQRACAASVVQHFHPPSPHLMWAGEVYRHDRIRVAYVSADFHEHAVAFLTAGLFELHDHRRFEVTAVVFGLDHASPMRTRIEATFDHVIDVRKQSDGDVARMLRDREIDIAVDLMGYTSHSRTKIFALRPAPVQVNYLGFPGTMGAPYIDYIVADRFLIPEVLRQHYAENVVYMPDVFQVNDAKRQISDQTPSRAEVGLPPEGFVFCCLNNSYKVTPEMFAIWMRLLDGVPGSMLWLVAGNPMVQTNLRREAHSRGVAPDRLVFAKRLPPDKYLAQYRLADLFLDTLPFNGGATVSDALWAGLPVVTCAGQAFAARMAGSLLQAIGLPELVTHSLPDYEALALQLATDKPRLTELRQRLARNRVTYPLFDTDLFRRHIEAAYVTMWEKTQRGEPPATFAVERES